jgi:hypothetical protein
MTKRAHTPIILALLIVATLAGAYLIVAQRGVANGSGEEPPTGFLH